MRSSWSPLLLLTAVLAVAVSALVVVAAVGRWSTAPQEAFVAEQRALLAHEFPAEATVPPSVLDDVTSPPVAAFTTGLATPLVHIVAVPLSAAVRAELREVVAGKRAPWAVSSPTHDARTAARADVAAALDVVRARTAGPPLTATVLDGVTDLGLVLAVEIVGSRSRGREHDAEVMCARGMRLGELIANTGDLVAETAGADLQRQLRPVCREQLGVGGSAPANIAALRELPGLRRPLFVSARASGLALIESTLATIAQPRAPSTSLRHHLAQQLTLRLGSREALPLLDAALQDIAEGRTPSSTSSTSSSFGADRLLAPWHDALQSARIGRAARELERRLMIGRLALEQFHRDNGHWPADVAMLVAAQQGDAAALAAELRRPDTDEPFTLTQHASWAILEVPSEGLAIRAMPSTEP
ncbi:MAG TPA: hypothetical protein VGF99_18975, partial [Myxococcota bacterium]